MGLKGRITRDITVKECPWLGRDLKAGEKVYENGGLVYGTIDIPIIGDPGEVWPFFELPDDAIEWDNNK